MMMKYSIKVTSQFKRDLKLAKEALIKSRLTIWHTSCLQIFRHLARKLLEIRKYSCVAFVQADKKSDGAICAPDLISTSLKNVALI